MGLGDGVKGPQNGPPTPSPGLIKTFFLPKKRTLRSSRTEQHMARLLL